MCTYIPRPINNVSYYWLHDSIFRYHPVPPILYHSSSLMIHLTIRKSVMLSIDREEELRQHFHQTPEMMPHVQSLQLHKVKSGGKLNFSSCRVNALYYMLWQMERVIKVKERYTRAEIQKSMNSWPFVTVMAKQTHFYRPTVEEDWTTIDFFLLLTDVRGSI